MDFALDEEQRLLQDSVRRYVDTRYTFDRRRQIEASPSGWSQEVWTDFADFGWLALPLPAEEGGLGGSLVDVAVLTEQFGRTLVLEPYVSTVILGGGLLATLGDPTQRRTWLPRIAGGELRLAFAHAEPNTRHQMHCVEARATRVDGGWRLHGAKKTVLDAMAAHALLVSARIDGAADDAQGIGVFVVPRPQQGLVEKAFITVEGRRACHLSLEGVVVDDNARLRGASDAGMAIDTCCDQARIVCTADAVGCMDALLAATVAYTRTRVQFGQPLASYQVLRHRMADMSVACEEARSMLLHALLMAAASPPDRARAVSAAMHKVVRCARFVAEQAVQLHGAMGVTDEVTVGAWLKRLLAYESQHGTLSYHAQRHARLSDWALQGAAA
ncbi:acyl-CoA dehydrogenase family protein [Hydrogenophaga sp. BPS33]|uniref:acyl-CoA dehydrogenase family protein n=1 Tax=Hydrogenophaga sp. BPS33 TaxID=2651974 RepID=UPI0013200440|nr:acyl-CoA dehydrogenase [Hydrogenophaga sp. BPS33]QHE87523.1 pimeloyl-CoA dehydrogenase small subunit [Hydrogenophaga sp. BPS33]